MTELIPLLIAIIGALIGLLGFNARKTAKQNGETQRKNVESMDNDELIAEFDRLYDRNRR